MTHSAAVCSPQEATGTNSRRLPGPFLRPHVWGNGKAVSAGKTRDSQVCAARRGGFQTELKLELGDILGEGIPSASDRRMALGAVQTGRVDEPPRDVDPFPKLPSAAKPGIGTRAQCVSKPNASTALLS